MTYLTKFKLIFMAFAITALLTSCEKEVEENETEEYNTELSENESENSDNNSENESDVGESDCFDFIYPIEISYPDGTIKSIDSDSLLEIALDEWEEFSQDTLGELSLVFPIDVILEDDTEIQIIDELSYEDLYNSCEEGEEGEDEDDCFELLYPVTVIYPDGTSAVANSYQELDQLEEMWEDSNPDTEEEPILLFPVEIVLNDGTITEVATEQDLEDLEDNCEEMEEEEDEEDCFELIYPVTMVYPDGTTIEANSYVELEQLEEMWEDNNSDTEEEPSLKFPLNVLLSDGTTLEVSTDQELENLEDECDD